MSVRSMTGFARRRRTIDAYDVTLSLKGVNHRGLDLHFHTFPALDPFEGAMRAAMKQKAARGHIDIRIQVERADGAEEENADAARLHQYVRAYREAAARLGLAGEPDLNAALCLPGMLTGAMPAEFSVPFGEQLLALLNETLDAFNEFRTREGAELATFLLDRNQSVAQAAERMESVRTRVLPHFQARLEERLRELLAGAELDAQRIVQEAALLADRGDIGEETARLTIHSRQLTELVKGESEIGKKADFLLQEMNRETNTILSKTSGIGELGLEITQLAVNAKSDIEKMREQALNLE